MPEYLAPGVFVDTLTINGGTLSNTAGNEGFTTNFILNAGTVVSTGGAINFNTGFGITTLASDTTSVFSAPISIRGTSLVVTTDLGTTPSGIDLADSGVIFGGGTFTKEGPGLMQVSAVNTYTGATNVNAGTLRFTVSETLSELNIADGAIVELGGPAAAPAPFEDAVFGGGGEMIGAYRRRPCRSPARSGCCSPACSASWGGGSETVEPNFPG